MRKILAVLILATATCVMAYAQGTNTCQANNCPPVVTVNADPTGNQCVNVPQVTLYNGKTYGCTNGAIALAGGSSYTLPIAQPTTLGGIKPDNTTITVNASTGVASASGGGAPAWSAITAPTADLSLIMASYKTTFASTLGFAANQFNYNWQFPSNSINFSTEFAKYQISGGYASEAMDVGMSVPNTSTIFQANGLGVYMECASTTTFCVPIYTQGYANAAGVKAYGANFNVSDGTSGTNYAAGNLFGTEIDSQVYNSGSVGAGLAIGVNNFNGATFSSIDLLAATGSITNGILIENGVATNAMNIGYTTGNAAMPILFHSSTGSGAFGFNSANQFSFNQPIKISGAPSGSVITADGSSPGYATVTGIVQQLASYTFTVAENPLSFGGVFGVAGSGEAAGTVPSAGIFESVTAGTGSADFWVGYVWPNNQYVSCTIKALAPTSVAVLNTRMSASAYTSYQVNILSTALSLYAYVAGTPHQIGTTQTISAAANDTWKLDVQGGATPVLTISQNGTSVYQQTDSTYGATVAAGSPGFAIYDSAAIANAQFSSCSAGTP